MKDIQDVIKHAYKKSIWPDNAEVKVFFDDWKNTKSNKWPDDVGLCGCNFIEYQVLYDVCKLLNPSSILEIGSGFGASTVILCYASKSHCHISQVDPEPTKVIRTCFGDHLCPKRLTHHEMKSDDFWSINSAKYDFILIDGDHHPVVSELDVHHAVKSMSANGIVAVHDIIQPGSEYIADWCKESAEKNNKQCVLLDNTGGHGIGLIF